MIYWNPRVTLELWRSVSQGDQDTVDRLQPLVAALFQELVGTFSKRGFTDTAFDRLGGLASGFLQTSLRSRAPYPSVTPEDVKMLRGWYADFFPEMLEHEQG